MEVPTGDRVPGRRGASGYATSDLLVKVGLGGGSDPVYAAPLSVGVGFLVWAVAHTFRPVRRRFRLGKDARWLVLSGAFMGTAILLLFHALARGDVSLVAPVIGTQPLFVMLFSAVLLKHLEVRDRSTILAASIVVIGTILRVALGSQRGWDRGCVRDRGRSRSSRRRGAGSVPQPVASGHPRRS